MPYEGQLLDSSPDPDEKHAGKRDWLPQGRMGKSSLGFFGVGG